MAKKQKQKQKRKSYLIPAIGLMVILAGFYLLKKNAHHPVPVNHNIGGVETCRYKPAFIKKLGLRDPISIDFRQEEASGFQILEARQNGKKLRMPSWDDAGHLGPYTLDGQGNIYTAPVPYVSIAENPPQEQNKIYKVNTNDGKMKEFVSFTDNTPNNDNPYGVMGLAFDCETGALYAASIAGSTPKEQKGIIYKVDPKTKEIQDKLKGFDVIGMGIYKTKSGKKLYMGAARSPEIFSVLLDEKGNFSGTPTFEFSLAAQPGGSYDNAHRIRFMKNNEMEIKAIEFSYSLIASSDPLRNIYKFSYDFENDKWNFISVHKQEH